MIARFLTYWLAFSIICSNIWITHNFGSPIIEQVIFQLTFVEPLKGTFPPNIIFLFIKSAIIYPIFFATVIFILERIIVFIFKNLPCKIAINSNIKRVICNAHIGLFIFSLIYSATTFSLYSYISSQFNKELQFTSYVDPNNIKITAKDPKNLVLIYMESIEDAHRNKELFDKNLLASLDNIDAVKFNKYKQLLGTGWTVAGIFSTQCGEYLKLSFLTDNNICLSDILDKQGYHNVYMQGASLEFTKTGEFLKKHKYHELYGRDEWKEKGFTHLNAWGLYDDDLFAQAKIKFKSLHEERKPFNITILTVDTHTPNGYISNYCRARGVSCLEDIVECSATQVADFIQFIKENGYIKDTNIIILGDHLYPFRNAFPTLNQSDRSIFNLFIPPSAIIFFFVILDNKLNLIDPKNLFVLIVLNNGVKKIACTPCFSLILISFKLCAEPTTKKFFLFE